MKNLEQIRALHAFRFWEPEQATPGGAAAREKDVRGENDGDVVNGLVSLTMNNGLLATVAYAKAKGKGYETLMREVGRFLGSQGDDGRKLLPEPVDDLNKFVTVLTKNDSSLLQQATAEAMIYMGYLKRLAPKS